MAEGLPTALLTQREFIGADFTVAERIARRLGYKQTVYTSTSALWGLFCLAENPAHATRPSDRQHPPFVGGCIIHTRELGFLFVQTDEDLGLQADGRPK